MTPYELSKQLNIALSPIAPRLSAALNRALVDIGEGSALVGLGPGTHEDDRISLQENEYIDMKGKDTAVVMNQIMEQIQYLEANSTWRVIIDQKPGADGTTLELRYTIVRDRKGEL